MPQQMDYGRQASQAVLYFISHPKLQLANWSIKTKCFLRNISEEVYVSNFKIKQRTARDITREENWQEKEKLYEQNNRFHKRTAVFSTYRNTLSSFNALYVFFKSKNTPPPAKLVSSSLQTWFYCLLEHSHYFRHSQSSEARFVDRQRLQQWICCYLCIFYIKSVKHELENSLQ